MKIISLELKGAVRLELSGIKKITLKPDTNIMSIIGSNGSGKSSLLWYLSPLLPDKNDFTKDGYKKVTLEYNNNIYTLTSDLSTGKHSFIDENTGEELNVGGTSTMQKQLVKDYFNYNEKIHYLLTGKEKFTEMSPMRRKEWFTLLCDTDYTYAIGVFNKAKEKLRDAQGALKKLVQHQMQLTQVGNTEAIANFDDIIRQKQARVDELTKLAPYQDAYSEWDYNDRLKDKIQTNMFNIHNQNKTLSDSVKAINQTDFISFLGEDYPERLREAENRVANDRGIYSALVKEYTELENRLQRTQSVDKEEVKKTQEELSRLKAKRQELLSERASLGYSEDIADAYVLKSTIIDAQSAIQDTLYQISTFGSKRITGQEIASMAQQIELLKTQRTKYLYDYGRLEEKRNILKSREEREKAQCPNCNHEFHPGFDPEKMKEIERLMAELQGKVADTEKELLSLSSVYKEDQETYQKLVNFTQVARAYPALLGQLAARVLKEEWYLNEPGKIEEVWSKYEKAIRYQVEIEETDKEISAREKLLLDAENVDESIREQLNQQLHLMSIRIEEAQRNMSEAEYDLAYFTKRVKAYQAFLQARENLSDMLGKHDETIKELMDKEIYDMVLVYMTREREEISALSKQQMEHVAREASIESVNKQITKLKEEILIWEAIVDSMNPQDGLIAEGLLGYIRIFLSRMNGLISSIWTYPLIIHPSKISEEGNDELSYRFPMTVGLSEKPKADVQLGSDGIREVIDLAFRLVAMNALGLKDFPIYLDEFARTFDAKHRENGFRLVERLTEEHLENQIYIVSHSYMDYSVWTNIAYCVLSEDNIVLPSNNINRGVYIER